MVGYYVRFGVGFVVGSVVGYGVGPVAGCCAAYGAGVVVGYGQTGTMSTASKTNCVFKNCTEASDHGKGTESFAL